jgi:hypothetical protein
MRKYGEMYGIRIRTSNVNYVEQAVWTSLSRNKRRKIKKYGVKYDFCTSVPIDNFEAPTIVETEPSIPNADFVLQPLINLDNFEAPTNSPPAPLFNFDSDEPPTIMET